MDLQKAQTKDLLTWTSLTAAVDARLSPHSFVKKLLYGDVSPQETEEIEVSVIVGARQVAPFVKRNGEAIEVGNYSEDFQNIIAPSVAVKRHLTAKELKDRVENGLALTDLKRIAVKAKYQASMGTLTIEKLAEAKVPLIVGITVDGHDHFAVYRGKLCAASCRSASTTWV